jgi:hypothetical protein
MQFPLSPYVPQVTPASFKPTKVEAAEVVIFQEKAIQVYLCHHFKEIKYRFM